MIKNIIFDLDNTIIEDKEDCILCYKGALRDCGCNENDYLNIYNAIDDYDYSLNEFDCFYSKENLLKFLNKKLNKNYDMNLIDEINKVIGKCWTKPVFLPEDTLKYLASKYNLYVFTNWFEDCQAERLKNIGYLKYFSRVFGADTVGAKPFSSSFDEVLNFINASPDECIMIGDSKKNDILGANNVGIPAILFDYDSKRDKKEIFAPNYSVITNLKELEKIL